MTKEIHLVFEVLNFLHSNHAKSFNLTLLDQLILINLASHNGAKGIFPSVPTIAKEINVSDRQVTRRIKYLRELNLITIEKKFGKSNRYGLCITYPRGDTHVTTDTLAGGDTHVGMVVTPVSVCGDTHVGVYNKLITKEITNKSFCSSSNSKKDQAVDNSKKHDWAEKPKAPIVSADKQSTSFDVNRKHRETTASPLLQEYMTKMGVKDGN